jgi:import receptor subunit TOM20
MQHDCAPSAYVAFPDGTAELSLVAARDLTAGDELTVAYVDVAEHEGETIFAARRRRRMELARGWRFPCPCERCEQEASKEEPKEVGESKEGEAEAEETKDEDADVDGFMVMGDESRVEPSVNRREETEDGELQANID